MPLTVGDLTLIGCMYLVAIALVMWLARNPRHLKERAPRLHPLGLVALAVALIALGGVIIAAWVDPAAADLLARLLGD